MNITYLDFNDAKDAVSDSPEKLDPKQIKSALLGRLNGALTYLFPNGKIRNDQFFIGDLSGSEGKSLVIELSGEKAGLWHDFNTGESGDIFDAWAYHERLDCKNDFPKILENVANWLGSPMFFALTPTDIKSSAPIDELGPVTAKWDYFDKTGKLIACVYRYDPPCGKEFRPWDVKARKQQAPDPRPLYNQPGINKAQKVILVEGEKCADALIAKNITATTAMNGANAPIDKTDWSPLKGKDVTLWPDNDEAGITYADKAAEAIASAGAKSVTVLKIPQDKPPKWDCADAVDDNVDVDAFIKTTASTKQKSKRFDLRDWLACERFVGKPKEREWLSEGIFPMAQVSLLAASGGVGKSFLLAQLAREVAAFNGFKLTAPTLFGGDLAAKGAAVYITAEDDFIEMHLRLNALGKVPNHFYVVPLPDAGGVQPLFVPDPAKRMPTTSDFWESLVEQFKAIPDLRVIILDPLQPLCALDFNVPENAQFVCSKLSALAAETGASVVVSHHFAKREAITPEQAREAIRGSGGLVDGVRAAYALWQPPPDRAKSICKQLSCEYIRGCVVFGGVVKANGRANIKVTIFVRDQETGVLIDRSYELSHQKSAESEYLGDLLTAISQAAIEGKPYTKTGLNGVYERRFELPEVFHRFGKHKMVGLVETLLSESQIVTAMAPGSTAVKWLDEPEGPVALGEGKFQPGHLTKSVGKPKPFRNGSN